MEQMSPVFTAALQNILPVEIPPLLLILLMGGVFFSLCTAIVALLLFFFQRQRRQASELQLASAEHKIAMAMRRISEQEIRAAKLITLLKNERKHAAEKLQLLEEAREELSLKFNNLAQRIFDEKSARFSELNKEKLEAILSPFHQQLTAFKQEINEIYRNDSRERMSLKGEIIQLKGLNLQLNREATNLTRALKSDTKAQGNWGELVLNRVLERSGLRLGREYEIQGGFRDHQNRLLKPDVLIHLPEGRDIIVDSKVSLVSWERYMSCKEESEKPGHMDELVKAIRDHIHGLGNKNYPDLGGIRSLDFVLLFMPIEAAFAAALERDDRLVDEALVKNVIIVIPTTLLATLRTIENIWQYEHQNKNSLEIARRAGIMYDKFRSFVEEMEKIGKQLSTCHATYETALLKLTRGRGNLVASAEQLRELGVQIKKEIPKSITEISELELKN